MAAVHRTPLSFPKASNQAIIDAMSSDSITIPPAPVQAVPQAELAAHLAGRLCHDLISPVSAIVSGLDLLEDPSAQDMRDDAMNLIQQSARKLAVALSFARVAYGSSASAETFDPRDLEGLARAVFGHVRAELDWAVHSERLDKPAARALLNLAQLGITALPTGGVARVTVETESGETVVRLEARGPRARLRVEAQAGQWVQAYYLNALVSDAGGRVESTLGDDLVEISAILPIRGA